ncbi:MAG: YggS family pyridoxal phosphate-dependent enzyme [Treponema sp.]|jgi:pyridoxal phosphate enzyme (YggS family)|nr:YggS family pyridoxal phosphate-dependent enzyme [Treponema sp.]
MNIKENLEEIRERTEKAAVRSGRNPLEIRLMGISKFQNEKKIEEAVKAGLFLFGESKVQEAAAKFPALKKKYPDLELHMVGSLQRNKIKNALAVFDCFQSLDRDELISALGKITKPLTVLLEMHTGEESKSGYPDEDSLSRAVELVLSFPALKLSGLMTMAPFTKDRILIRQSFRKLISARNCLQRRFPDVDFSCLSMGMSNDFETAIEEGSTLIRIGTAIFGESL